MALKASGCNFKLLLMYFDIYCFIRSPSIGAKLIVRRRLGICRLSSCQDNRHRSANAIDMASAQHKEDVPMPNPRSNWRHASDQNTNN